MEEESKSLTVYIPPDEWLTDDGLIKKEYWPEYIKECISLGIDPAREECLLEGHQGQ